jgi:hypothetical protein
MILAPTTRFLMRLEASGQRKQLRALQDA